MTYNYQLDTLEGCFGQQPCRCGARNCSGFIGKKPEGSGLGPREAWRAAARKLLEMRMPPLVALQGLLAEGRALGVMASAASTAATPGAAAAAAAAEAMEEETGPVEGEGKEDGGGGAGDGGEEYAALAGKAEAAEAWLGRYRQLMGEWQQQESTEGEDASVSAPSAAAATKPEPPSDAAVADGAGSGLVEVEALAALVAEAPKDVKFPQATQARSLLTRARQVSPEGERVVGVVGVGCSGGLDWVVGLINMGLAYCTYVKRRPAPPCACCTTRRSRTGRARPRPRSHPLPTQQQ